MNTSRSFAPRLLAGLGTLALVAGVGLFASSRPAHTAGGPVPVSVANTPLATTAADNLALQSVTITNELSNATPGGKASSTFYTVPTGKRLVVDYVSSGAAIPNDTNRYSLFVATFRGNVAQYANFNQLPDSSPYSSASQKVQLFADAETPVVVQVYSNGTQPTNVFVTFTGHLVDVP